MSKLVWKPGAMLAPVPPVLVSCGTVEHPNAFTVAWTGIVNTNPAMTYISVRPERYSYSLIRDSGEFVINLTTTALVRTADFCGVRSGRDVDKFNICGLTAEKATQVLSPMIAESPLSMECRVKSVTPLGTHDMFLAEILAVNVDSSLVDAAGRLHLGKCGLTAYAHGEYYELGKRIGTFGFSVKKPEKKSAKRGKRR